MPYNPKSKANLAKGKRFTSEYQASNNGRSEDEFVIRQALLSNDGEKLKEIVDSLITQSTRHKDTRIDKDLGKCEITVPADPKCINILLERGFGKVKEKIELSGDLAEQIGALLAERIKPADE